LVGQEEGGLSERIAKQVIEELSKKPDKMKEFKLPFGKRTGVKGKMKKNFVLAIIMKTNGNFDLKWVKIKNDLVYLKESDTYHTASTDFIGYYKKYPVMLLPEWDLTPLKRENLYAQAEEGRLAKAQTVIIQNIMMANGLLKGKKSMGSMLIWLLVGGVIIYLGYNLISGGKG